MLLLLVLLASVLCSSSMGAETESRNETESKNTTEKACWTPYYDRNVPNYRDWDERELLYNHLGDGYSLCDNPLDIQCVTQNGVSYTDTTDREVSCSKERGLDCDSYYQSSRRCQNYKVRYLCPGMCKRHCGRSLFLPSGQTTIEAPIGKAPARCKWTIKTLPHQYLKIIMSNNHLMKGMKLTVYDGKGKEATQLLKARAGHYDDGEYFWKEVVFSSTKIVHVRYSAALGGETSWKLTIVVLPPAVRFSPCSFDNNTCGWQTSKMLKIGQCDDERNDVPRCGSPSAGGLAFLTNLHSGYPSATLTSPMFKAVQSKCLSLRFLISGRDGIHLRVYIKFYNDTVYSSGHWQHTENKWRRGYLQVMNDARFYVFITMAMRVKTSEFERHDMVAIDDIRLEKCVHDIPCIYMDGGEMDCPLTYKPGHGEWLRVSLTSQKRLPPVLPIKSFNWTSMGCWQPSMCVLPLISLEDNVDILQDYSLVRSDPVGKCAVAAYAAGHTAFAVQRQGQCHGLNDYELMQGFKKVDGDCNRDLVADGSYEVFNITRVNGHSRPTFETTEDDVFVFQQTDNVLEYIRRSSVSFKVVPPRGKAKEPSCIYFRYKTSFKDARVEAVNYKYNVNKSRATTVWQMPQLEHKRSPIWRSAAVMLPTNETDLAAERVRIRPFETPRKGYFRIMDLVAAYPCSTEPQNCSFDDSNCGWRSSSSIYTSHSISGFSWQRGYTNNRGLHTVGTVSIKYTRYYRSNVHQKKDFVVLWHPTIFSKGHRCLAFHYIMESSMQKHAGWGFSARVFANEKIYSEVVPTNASGKWELGLLQLPRQRNTLMKIEFLACKECSVALDDFVFTYKPCSADKNECGCSSPPCGHICINTFGGHLCRCRQGYELHSDNKTCIPVCNSNQCLYGKCVAPNVCECFSGFTGSNCQLSCGPLYLTNETGAIISPTLSMSRYRYYGLIQCNWTIRAPAGHVVALDAGEPHWHSRFGCDREYLRIKNRKDESRARVAKLCYRSGSVRRFISTTNKLFVSYSSSGYSYGTTFRLRYEMHKKTDCLKNCNNLLWWQKCCHGFLVAVPNVFRQGAKTTIDVSLPKMEYAVFVVGELVKAGKTVLGPVETLISNHGSLTLQIPDDLPIGEYQFNVTAMNGDRIEFRRSTEVAVASRGPTVLVQTDKPVYKPGQTVRMRIVSMDYNLKPYDGNLSVIISDGKGTKILQWEDLLVTNGVIHRSLMLSSQPVTGKWKIIVSTLPAQESIVQVACFEVKEYVLPKFEINLFAPSYILRNVPENISVAVSSRYSYGKLVKGKVCVNVTTVHLSHFSNYYKPSTQSVCKESNGLITFVFDSTSFLSKWSRISYSLRPQSVKVQATVTEQGTGVMDISTEIIPFANHQYILSFKPGTEDFYKPGLPFKAQISVASPDKRAAVGLLQVKVDVKDGWRQLYSFDAEVENGFVEFDIFHSRNHFSSRLSIHAEIPGKSLRVNHYSNPRPAAGDHYMTIMPNISTLQSGIPTFVFIKTTAEVRSTLFAMAVSRARILNSWTVNIETTPSSTYDGVHEFTLPLTPLCSWAPRFDLVLYYVAEGYLVVADTISMRVQQCFEHKVTMTFNRNESRPGEDVGLLIQSAPHSHVSLTAVDKSVYLLDSNCGSQISADKVLSELTKYETGSKFEASVEDQEADGSGSGILSNQNQRDWWRSWWDLRKVPYYFKSAGISVLSDYQFVQKKDGQRLRREFESDAASGRGGELSKLNPTGDDTDDEEEIDQFVSVERVRSYFPEAWLWEDQQSDENGHVHLNLTVPDTITTWIADAFVMSHTASFGMTAVPSSLVAFKPFFISLSLPYSVIRKEEVEIIATVFNYYFEDLKVVMELDLTTGGFDFVSDSAASKVPLMVPAQNSRTARFPIVPRQLGHIPLKVTAHSRVESDSVIRMLLVEPEGIKQMYSRSLLIIEEGNETMSLELPDVIVVNSTHGVISLSADVIGPAIDSIGSTLRMPYGCGEQNMINFAPAVLIKRYLITVNKLTPKVDAKASRYMNIGYQKELTYQRSDGSYAVWGDRSSSGSTCLTGFVSRVFAQAKPLMYIDDNSLSQSVCWLVRQQREEGHFTEPGSCYHLGCGRYDMDTTLTSYTLITLLEVSKVQTIRCGLDEDAVRFATAKALAYLENRNSSEMNSYVLAMTTYALSLAQSKHSANFLSELSKRVQGNDKMHFWTCGDPYCYGWRSRYCRHRQGTVEATAYAMLAYLEMGQLADARLIETWLVSQMDSKGGYRSTQDSVIALMALSDLKQRLGWQAVDLTIRASDASGFNHVFAFTTENKLITQSVEIDIPTVIHFTVEGVGNILLQAEVTYNIPEVDPDDSFSINVTAALPNATKATVSPSVSSAQPTGHSLSPLVMVTSRQSSPIPTKSTISTTSASSNTTTEHVLSTGPTRQTVAPINNFVLENNNQVQLEVCSSWQRTDTESSMAIVEVGLLSGFEANQNELSNLVENNNIELQRFETEGRKVVLYFDQVKKDSPACFTMIQERTHCVANIQPAFIQAYSYYEPDYQTTTSYQPPSALSGGLDMCTLGKEIQEEGAVSDVTDESPSTVFVTSGGDQSDSESLMDAM